MVLMGGATLDKMTATEKSFSVQERPRKTCERKRHQQRLSRWILHTSSKVEYLWKDIFQDRLRLVGEVKGTALVQI